MSGLQWVGWAEPAAFGLTVVLALLGAECLVLAQKIQKKHPVLQRHDPMLRSEFGGGLAPGAEFKAVESAPKIVTRLAALGGFFLLLSILVSTVSFG